MSEKMDKKQKKQLDLKVLQQLVDNGILNHLHAGMLTDVAETVRHSDCEAMKPYKTFKRDENSRIASEIVFEYLTRHKMWETIRCIETETEGQLNAGVLKRPSGLVAKTLKISGSSELIGKFVGEWQQLLDQNSEFLADNSRELKEQLSARLDQCKKKSHRASESKPAPAPTQKPKPKPPAAAKPGNDDVAESDSDLPQLPPSKKTKPTTQKDDEFADFSSDPPAKPSNKKPAKPVTTLTNDDDFDSFDEPSPRSKSPAKPTKNDSGDFTNSFQDGDDEPETFADKRGKPKAKPLPQARKAAEKSESSGLQDLDDMLDQLDDPVPAKKPSLTKTTAKQTTGFADDDFESVSDSPQPKGKAKPAAQTRKVQPVGMGSDDDISLGLSEDSLDAKKPAAKGPVKKKPLQAAKIPTDTDSDVALNLDDW